MHPIVKFTEDEFTYDTFKRVMFEILAFRTEPFIIEEYLFHSTTIADKEICFMACISKLLNL
jgi:hypothetical protein